LYLGIISSLTASKSVAGLLAISWTAAGGSAMVRVEFAKKIKGLVGHASWLIFTSSRKLDKLRFQAVGSQIMTTSRTYDVLFQTCVFRFKQIWIFSFFNGHSEHHSDAKRSPCSRFLRHSERVHAGTFIQQL
jgi:hypothetical protein